MVLKDVLNEKYISVDGFYSCCCPECGCNFKVPCRSLSFWGNIDSYYNIGYDSSPLTLDTEIEYVSDDQYSCTLVNPYPEYCPDCGGEERTELEEIKRERAENSSDLVSDLGLPFD